MCVIHKSILICTRESHPSLAFSRAKSLAGCGWTEIPSPEGWDVGHILEASHSEVFCAEVSSSSVQQLFMRHKHNHHTCPSPREPFCSAALLLVCFPLCRNAEEDLSFPPSVRIDEPLSPLPFPLFPLGAFRGRIFPLAKRKWQNKQGYLVVSGEILASF